MQFIHLARSTVAALVLAGAAGPALSAVTDRYPGDGATVAAEAAKGWRASDGARRSIDEIRAAIGSSLAPTAPGPAAMQLADLGRAIRGRVDALLAACSRDATPASRHLCMLLAEIADGTDLMMKATHVDARRTGLLRVVQALNLYGGMFEHPGWRPLDEPIEVSAR